MKSSVFKLSRRLTSIRLLRTTEKQTSEFSLQSNVGAGSTNVDNSSKLCAWSVPTLTTYWLVICAERTLNCSNSWPTMLLSMSVLPKLWLLKSSIYLMLRRLLCTGCGRLEPKSFTKILRKTSQNAGNYNS